MRIVLYIRAAAFRFATRLSSRGNILMNIVLPPPPLLLWGEGHLAPRYLCYPTALLPSFPAHGIVNLPILEVNPVSQTLRMPGGGGDSVIPPWPCPASPPPANKGTPLQTLASPFQTCLQILPQNAAPSFHVRRSKTASIFLMSGLLFCFRLGSPGKAEREGAQLCRRQPSPSKVPSYYL